MKKTIRDYFDIQELVCQDVFDKFGQTAWQFFDQRLLDTMLFIREAIGKPIYVNNWQIGGNLSQRGLRCNLCALVEAKTASNTPYLSAHVQGMALDFNVVGQTSEQTRQWLYNNKHILPHAIRIEQDTTTWVHVDVRNTSSEKILMFK